MRKLIPRGRRPLEWSRQTPAPTAETTEINSRIQSIQRVDLVPRVTAFLNERLFTEGADVKKGDMRVINSREEDTMALSIRDVRGAGIALMLVPGLASEMSNAQAAQVDWPSYNRTLTSERFVPLNQIDTTNAQSLKVLCTYDTKQMTGFQTGLLQVDGALFASTEQDTFSIDPNTCQEKWRDHQEIPHSMLQVNRGVAVLDGHVFRGFNDGQVRAFDAKSGKILWTTPIADAAKGESIPASPIAWNGLVFIGNAGGDNKGVKGRIYALDAATGKIVWEFYLVPRGPEDTLRGPEAKGAPVDMRASWKNASGSPITGGGVWTSYTLDPTKGLLYVPGGNPAPDFVGEEREGANLLTSSIVVLDAKTGTYKRHFQIVKHDFHDWDASTAPALFTTKSGKHLMAVAPKDGHLYAFDIATDRLLYRRPVTTVANAKAPLTTSGTRFCPGSQGGAEWNGPAYDPTTDLILTGEVDWCTTIHTDPLTLVRSVPLAQPWSGSKDGFGVMDNTSDWAGWLIATDAATGTKKWQFKSPYPIMSGVTPTSGRIVLAGDMGGNFYVFDAAQGKVLWSQNLGGAIAGGVITYDTGAGQKIAVAAGMTSPIWPTAKVTGKIVLLGLH
ncbi:PQQ-binding-like beta-propeller repeat protein [Bradyrhizobium betae]|uniref:PQQ-binding-like beta-propeller repeat protein n=2 Tax=Bradyrhizobium betae TaxID=244734 RepID=A0A5P6P9H6_9BRAD|nr:PQQ-binding-like beta-propeller repeat protein [Bradyrhizobium betae]